MSDYDDFMCPECGNTEFKKDLSTGEIYCTKCGLILQNTIENIMVLM